MSSGMTMNGSHHVDKVELAKRAREARERNKYSQMEAAQDIGVGQGWISQIELQKLNLHEDNLLKVRDLAKHLGFQIPYLPATSVIEEKAIEPSRASVRTDMAGDLETDVIKACAAELAKLNDQKACQRVLKYLSARFVWLDEPLNRQPQQG